MRVMVCGTNYGATYIRALSMGAANLRAVAIMSTGSARSRSMAQNLGLAHYTNVDEIPDNSVDIACVAVPGDAGHKLALDLLAKGIHVLAEHPVACQQMSEGLAQAKKHGRLYQVNAHFADLQAPQSFYQAFQVASQQSQCMHYELSVNLRTLYSGLDLLGRAIGSLKDIETRALPVDPQSPPPFASVQLTGKGYSVSLLCQNFASAADDGSATLLNHRFSATFMHGNLLLGESNGPVLWFPSPVSLPPEQWQTYMPVEMAPLNQSQLTGQRDSANLLTLQNMASAIAGQPKLAWQHEDYLMDLAKLWEDVLGLMQPQLAQQNAA